MPLDEFRPDVDKDEKTKPEATPPANKVVLTKPHSAPTEIKPLQLRPTLKPHDGARSAIMPRLNGTGSHAAALANGESSAVHKALDGSANVPTFILHLESPAGEKSRIEVWVKKRTKNGSEEIKGSSYLTIHAANRSKIVDRIVQKVKDLGDPTEELDLKYSADREVVRMRVDSDYKTLSSHTRLALQDMVDDLQAGGIVITLERQRDIHKKGYQQAAIIQAALDPMLITDDAVVAAADTVVVATHNMNRAKPDRFTHEMGFDQNPLKEAAAKRVQMETYTYHLITKKLMPAIKLAVENEFKVKRGNDDLDPDVAIGEIPRDRIFQIISETVEREVLDKIAVKGRDVLGDNPWKVDNTDLPALEEEIVRKARIETEKAEADKAWQLRLRGADGAGGLKRFTDKLSETIFLSVEQHIATARENADVIDLAVGDYEARPATKPRGR